ncbi:dehydrogenase/reductase SDR family member 7 [Aplysia californica]|uniref:Dehydrogenase/reductase SDR family member 7 n=1 Tax=Aplysia californica TaxID=6500 RepID=A0ABM0JUD6_APLCA|nr:dehydrogenase/reductase SDR family member 7 [Aplysia californica]
MIFSEVLIAVVVVLVLSVLFILSRSEVNLRLWWSIKMGKPIDHLQGQVVWITGASSGIGEFTAYKLAEAGCKLVLSARRADELERVKAACLRAGGPKLRETDVLVLPLDSTKFATHKEAVASVLSYFQKIDILVNNAGKSQRAGWLEVELAVDRELFELNVLGPVSLTREVLPHMIDRRRGHIVVISSIAGKLGIPQSRSYNGSKSAVQGYFECLRTEMGEHNIDVTVVCPGPVFSKAFMHAATGTAGESLGREMSSTEKRISTERCAHLVAIATANRLPEVWISQHPWLALLYLNQYWADACRWLFLRFGTGYMMKMRDCQ